MSIFVDLVILICRNQKLIGLYMFNMNSGVERPLRPDTLWNFLHMVTHVSMKWSRYSGILPKLALDDSCCVNDYLAIV